jgi:hypothetical protein
LILVAGSRAVIEETTSGALEEVVLNGGKDVKSGAFVAVKKSAMKN